LTVAGTIRDSSGVSANPMRVLGAYAAVYLVSGSGRYQDANGIDRPVRAGDVLFIFPDVPHAYGPSPGERWSEIYVVFDGPLFDAWRHAGVLTETQPIHHASPVNYWFRRWRDVVPNQHDNSAALTHLCRLQQVIADVLLNHGGEVTGSQDRDWITQAQAMLGRVDPTRRPDWSRIAERLGLSYAGFRKRFVRLARVTPAAYVEQQRLAQATNLLLASDTPLKQIARDSGFCDAFHFSRRFKVHTGVTPREYRRRFGGRAGVSSADA